MKRQGRKLGSATDVQPKPLRRYLYASSKEGRLVAKLLPTDSMERKRVISPDTVEESRWTGNGIAYPKVMSTSDTDCLNEQGSN